MGTFKHEQRGVALAIAGALATTITVLGFAAVADQAGAAMLSADGLQHALRLDLFVIIRLMATIGNVARLRFVSENDIDGSSSEKESAEVRDARAILQNTLEQVVLAIVTHVIVAAVFDRPTALIAALVFLFFVGRLMF